MMTYEEFEREYRSYYPLPDAIKAAYERLQKSGRNELLTFEEFALETRMEDLESVRPAYDRLVALVQRGALFERDVYQYAHYRWCIRNADAIVAYETGPHNMWEVNSCDTELSQGLAIDKINDEWRFEREYIEIVGTAYYDASDWNFIRFDVDGMHWLMHDGELDQVYD